MKKLTALTVLFILLFTFLSFGAKVDGEEIESTLINGITMAPLEDIARVMNLEFLPSSGQYAVSEKNDTPRMLNFVHSEPEKVYAQLYNKNKDGGLELADEQEFNLPEKAVRLDGKLYVPFRFVLEYFDAFVYWNEKDGAYAYRSSYGEMTLIRTDGNVRERVSVEGGFESGTISGKYFVYVNGENLYKMNLETGEKTVLGKSGKVNVYGNKVYVLGGGKLTLINLETGEAKTVRENVVMVGYTADKGAWCESPEGTFVYDNEGNLITEVTGEFFESWDFWDGFVYYLTKDGEMRRAKPDGTEDERIIKIALYPEWIDGGIYYTDIAGNYRRFDVITGEDIMVYGLNLGFVAKFEEQHILNFYADAEEGYKMFISMPDGMKFRQFGADGLASSDNVDLYKEGIAIRNVVDDAAYYVTEKCAVKLSDDHINDFYGVFGDFVYYSVY